MTLRTVTLAAVALVASLALTACGTSDDSRVSEIPVKIPAQTSAPVQIPGTPCQTDLTGALKAKGAACAKAERVVKQFIATTRSPESVLTVDNFVCRESDGQVSCTRGQAKITYRASP